MASSTVSIADEPAFRIGSAEVRPAAREISARDRKVVLEPRTMQVLVLLARRSGEVVSRQALIDGCWGGRVVGEDAVNRALLKLRRVVREVGADDLTVETIPRVGYRLSAALDAAESPPAPPVAASGARRRWIAGGLAAGVVVGGGAIAWTALVHRPPRSPAVQELYLRGKAAFQRGAPEDNAEAVAYFQRVVATNAADAEAWSALALALRFEQSFVSPAQTARAEARAEAALRRANALDPGQPDAIAAQALYIPFRRHWLETERRLVEGLRQTPKSGVLNGFYGKLLAAVGRTEAACARFKLSLAAESFVPILRGDYAGALWATGRVAEADRVLDEASALWPRYVQLWWLRFWLFALTGRPDRADALLARGAPPEVKAAAVRALQAAVAALRDGAPTGRAAAVRATLAAVQQGEMSAADAAELSAALGDAGSAFAFARRALASLIAPDGRRPGQPMFLFRPPMARLRADSRYLALLQDVGLTTYWSQARVRPDARPEPRA